MIDFLFGDPGHDSNEHEININIGSNQNVDPIHPALSPVAAQPSVVPYSPGVIPPLPQAQPSKNDNLCFYNFLNVFI